MKKLLLTLALGAAVSLSASADTYYECLFGATYNSKSVSSYTDTWSATNQGSQFDIVNFNNNKNGWDYVKCGRKGNASVATITTDFSAPQAINEVVLNYKINEADVMNAIKLETSATADFATVLSTVEATSEQINTKGTAASDITFTLTNPAANLYYRLTFDCKSAKANGIVFVYSVKYNGGAGQVTLKDAELSFPEEKYTVTIGEPFTAPELTKATPAAATYSSDKETVATVDATTGAVTVVGVGTARITATTEATDEYKAGTASYLLTVNKVVVPVDVELATTIADGKYAFFIPEHGVCKPITGSSFGYPIAEAVEVTDNKFTTNEDYLVTITNVADKGYTIKDVNEKYWGMDATHFGGINVYTDADAANSNCYWNIEFVDNTVKVANTGREGAYISFKSYNSDWELVTTDTADQPLPQLFKVYIPTGVAEIETAENAPVEYFNLQGVRVANPENGLYIRRQGNKVSKVIVK